MEQIIDRLRKNRDLSDEEFLALLTESSEESKQYLFSSARAVRQSVYGDDVYIRGLIEVSNYCKNDCLYCGIRRSNQKVSRYRLDEKTILACCDVGYDLGFRTFVLQGGEDGWYHDERLAAIIRKIKAKYPDTAITISLGERSEDSYRLLFEAGADRYLLRHETIHPEHYQRLHPPKMSLQNRVACLNTLKDIGYQVGCGMMVGSPFQKMEYLLEDLRFLRDFNPQMVGIGPFLPHRDTPFGDRPAGSVELTLILLAIIRLILPNVLLPATTALGTAVEDGRERGILAGANVVMPNLSPADVRMKYMLYNNKRSYGSEAAECLDDLKRRMEKIGCHVVVSKGDYKNML
jgi:biotin synthase